MNLEPTSPAEARELVQTVYEERGTLSIRGGGTQRVTPSGKVLHTTGLNNWRFFEPDDMVLGVDGGQSVDVLLDRVVGAGMHLPLEPWFTGSTIGGLVAGNTWGPSRLNRGGIRDFIIGMEYVDGFAKLIKTGGRVVKNVTGYDLGKMMTGSLGGLGLITGINLKMNPAPLAPHHACFRMRGNHWLEWFREEVYPLPLDHFQAVWRQGEWFLSMGYSGPAARRARIVEALSVAFDHQLSLHKGAEAPRSMPWFAGRHRQRGFLSPHVAQWGDVWFHIHGIAPTAAFLGKSKPIKGLQRFEQCTLVLHPVGGDVHLIGPAAALDEAKLDGLRRAFSGTGAYLNLLRVPDALIGAFGMTVPLPGEYPLQQRVKRQLDPRGVFKAPYYEMV